MSATPLPISSLNDRRHVEKLTDWQSEPDLPSLKMDLQNAKPTRDAHAIKVRQWLDNLNLEGKARINAPKGRSQVQPKLIRKNAEWRYSALSEPFLSNDKVFQISPTTWEDVAAAQQNELVLNWQFRTKLNPVFFVDQFVRTAVDEGTVAVKVGWCRETRKVKEKAPVYGFFPTMDPQKIQGLEEAIQLKHSNPNAFLDMAEDVRQAVDYTIEVGAPHTAVLLKYELVEVEKVIKNEPTVEVIEITNLYVDPSCQGDPDKALFMAYTFEATRASLIRDGRYKNLTAVDWGQSILATPDHETSTPAEFNFSDDARRKVVVTEYWGYWDIDGSGHFVPFVAAWIGNVLIRLEKNPFPDGKPPFVIIPFMPKKKSIYGEPDGELLEDNQKIVGAVTRGMIDIMARSANGQRGMAKGMLDVVNKRRFDSGQDYEFNPNVHPANGMIEHKFPEIPQSAPLMVQSQHMEAESLTGVKMFGEGVTGSSLGQVAAGVRGALDASSKREMGILRRLAKGMAIVGQKIISMNQEFLSEKEVIRVTNEEFVTVRRDEIQGLFDLKVDISTAEEDNAKASELGFMLQTMGNNLDLEMVKIILAEIARLRRMPELAHKIKNFQPAPNPLSELQVEELKAKIEYYRSQTAERYAQAQLDGAKARTEASTADLKDLDFVEQETGTKHARDIDRIAQQGDSNAAREIVKAPLNRSSKKKPDGTVEIVGPKDEDIEAAVGLHALTQTRSPQ